jgi:hypothetical protein
MKYSFVPLFSISMIACFNHIQVGIIDSSFYGFTVKHEIKINAFPDSVFIYIVKDIGKWWDSEHTYSGNAANLSIELSQTGCFCEKLQSGGVIKHMSVIYSDPGKTLRLSGGLGPLQALAVNGTLTINLTPEDNVTKAVFIYTVGGYAPEGLQHYAAIVDQVLSQQWQGLKTYVETLPDPSDPGKSGRK